VKKKLRGKRATTDGLHKTGTTSGEILEEKSSSRKNDIALGEGEDQQKKNRNHKKKKRGAEEPDKEKIRSVAGGGRSAAERRNVSGPRDAA